MISKIISLVVFTGTIFIITSCTSGLPPERVESTGSTKVISEPAATTTIDVCSPPDVPDITFPRQQPVDGFREVMEAELIGDLVTQDGCLRIDSLYGDDSFLPVWPPEFKLVLDSRTIVILDGDGNVVGRVGEEIYMGGGTGSIDAIPDCIRQKMPVACNGPYWVVGSGVRLNIQSDPELIDITVVTTTERTGIYLSKTPVLDEWVKEPGTTAGKLRLYTPQRCPRIQSESGPTDYLLIWPPAYSLQFKDDLVEVIDSSGKLVAREGDDLVLTGGPIPHTWESEYYRQLYYEIPGDCYGPYWIVSESANSN